MTRKNKLSRKVVVLSALAVGLALSGCSSDNDKSGGWQDELVEQGALIIGTSGNFDPYTFQQGNETVGYSIDQCVELANRMGLEPRLEVVDFSGVMTGIQSGRVDVACSGELSQTEERQQSNSFFLSVPTLYDSTGIMARADSEATSIDDAKGANVGAITGSASPGILEKHLDGDVTITGFPGLAEATTALQQGRVEFVTASNLVLHYYTGKNEELKVVEAGLAPINGGLIISRNEALRDEINRVSQEMLDDGTIAELQEQWFGTTALPEES